MRKEQLPIWELPYFLEEYWKCNYEEGCNRYSYYHTTCVKGAEGKHIYICPKHLEEYLDY